MAGVNPPAGQQQVYTPPPQAQAQEENTSGPAIRQVEEEVRGRLREEIARKQAETDQLVSVGEKLSEGNSRLSVITSRLQQELAETESSLDLLRQKTEEMKLTKERLGESLSQLDCNEAVTATAPLYTQLIEGEQRGLSSLLSLAFFLLSTRRGRSNRRCSVLPWRISQEGNH